MILNKEGHIAAVLVGQPNNPTWADAIEETASVMQGAASWELGSFVGGHIGNKYLSHRRETLSHFLRCQETLFTRRSGTHREAEKMLVNNPDYQVLI